MGKSRAGASVYLLRTGIWLPDSSTSATAGAAANGTTPSQHGAKSDTDNDDDTTSLSPSDVEDPEITAYDIFFRFHSCP
jgi:hypothetical protein